jgi:hypothetical protein
MTVTFADKVRREIYLSRLGDALTDYPGARGVRRELRREVTATAQERGMRAALDDLGDPRVLAAGYLAELDHPVPRWSVGAIWGALSVGALYLLVLTFWIGTLNTLEATGAETMTQPTLGGEWVFVHTPDEISVTGEFTWGWFAVYLVVFLVPFLLGARAWRWRRSPRRAATMPAAAS